MRRFEAKRSLLQGIGSAVPIRPVLPEITAVTISGAGSAAATAADGGAAYRKPSAR